MLFIVLYVCEISSSNNGVVRKVFGPEWGKVTGNWRKLATEELNDFYLSPNIVWVMKSTIMRCVVPVEEKIEAYIVSVRKLDGGRPFRGVTHKWGDNIKMNL
jgi:hypothetical protein